MESDDKIISQFDARPAPVVPTENEEKSAAGEEQDGEDEKIEELDDLEFLLEEIESKIAPLA